MSKYDPTNIYGKTGLTQFSGYVYEEFIPDLQLGRGIQIYKEMRDNDPVIGAMLFAVTTLVSQVKWHVQEGGTEQEDLKAKEFLESCMEDMDTGWVSLIKEIFMGMLPFGFDYRECVYKRRLGTFLKDPKYNSSYSDGLIGWRRIAGRSADTIVGPGRWKFDDDGLLMGAWQISPPDYRLRFLPIEKCLLFRTAYDSKDNPQGRSVLRNAYRPWYFKKNIEVVEGIGIERDLAGLPVMKVPAEWLYKNADQKHKDLVNEYKKILLNIRRDEQDGLMLPNAYDENGHPLIEFELMSASGNRQFDTDKVINRKNVEIAMTLLADFILLGHDKTGSFALADSKTSIFASAIGSFLDEIMDVFNRIEIPRLFMYNKGAFNITKLPKLAHGDIESVDLQKLGDFISKLSMSGMPLFPDDALENWFRKQAGMPIKEIDKLNEDLTSATDEDEANTDEDDKISDPSQPDIEAVKPQDKPELETELKPTDKPIQPAEPNQGLPLQEPIKRKKQLAEKKSVVKKIMKFLGLK
jgi:hypothetical protein